MKNFDPFSLPTIPLSSRGDAPKIPSIYFVHDGSDILYIGQTNNLKRRFVGMTHDVLIAMMRSGIALKNLYLSWLPCDTGNLNALEKDYVERYNPLFCKGCTNYNRDKAAERLQKSKSNKENQS